MKKYIFILIPFALAVACKQNSSTNSQASTLTDSTLVASSNAGEAAEAFYTFELDSKNRNALANTVGVVQFDQQNTDADFGNIPIELLNEDGSLWMSFKFYYEELLREKGVDMSSYTMDDIKKLFKWNDDFSPWAFNIDYNVLVLRCVEVNDDTYTVVVNDEKNIQKHIKKQPHMSFQTWEEHMLSKQLIEFDLKNNPMRAEPSTTAKPVSKKDMVLSEVCSILEMKGDWIKLSTSYIENDDEHAIEGWIRWRDGNSLLANLYYML